MRARIRRIILIVISGAFLSCGEDSSSDAWPVDEPGPQVAENECETGDDCGKDAYCHEPSDCTAPKYCEDGFPPYSAAPPNLACSCDGRIISVNAGYPGRHAWGIRGVYDTVQVDDACDVDAEFPVEYLIRVELEGEPPQELLARFSMDGQEQGPVPVPNDGNLEWRAEGDSWPDFDVRFLLDLDGDGTCSDGDQVFSSYAENIQVNFEAFEVAATLSLQQPQSDCERW